MSFNISLESLVDLIGFIIGTSLGIGVLIYHWKKKSFFFLGLFILTYSLDVSSSFIYDIFGENNATIAFSLLNFSWLLFPLFYVYVQHISTLKAEDIKIPLIIGSIGLLSSFIVNILIVEQIDISHVLEIIIVNLEVLLSCWIAYKTLSWIKKQKKVVYNHFSDATDKELNWSRTYVLLGLIFTLVGYLSFITDTEMGWFFYIFNTINVVLLIWISIRSVFQFQIEKTVEKKKELKHPIEKNTTKQNDVIEIIKSHINKTKCYKTHNLTITDISQLSNIHTKTISESINSILASNFNSFINQFRINEAKKMLQNSDFSNLSIEGIGQEVGFRSKSTFYRSFKKETGITPKEFLAQNSSKF